MAAVSKQLATSILLLVAACGGSASPPTVALAPAAPSAAPSPPQPKPEEIVRAFWSGMNACDVAKVRALVALPMAWGKGCEAILTREALEKQLAEDLVGGDHQPKEPDLVRELHGKWDAHDESFATPFDRLSGAQNACPSMPAAAAEALRVRRHRHYLADGYLTRLSLIDGAWRVTGWSGHGDQ